MTISPETEPVAMPIEASGHFFHHAFMAPTDFFASLHPCGVSGFLLVGEQGKTAHLYLVAYSIAASSNLFIFFYDLYDYPARLFRFAKSKFCTVTSGNGLHCLL